MGPRWGNFPTDIQMDAHNQKGRAATATTTTTDATTTTATTTNGYGNQEWLCTTIEDKCWHWTYTKVLHLFQVDIVDEWTWRTFTICILNEQSYPTILFVVGRSSTFRLHSTHLHFAQLYYIGNGTAKDSTMESWTWIPFICQLCVYVRIRPRDVDQGNCKRPFLWKWCLLSQWMEHHGRFIGRNLPIRHLSLIFCTTKSTNIWNSTRIPFITFVATTSVIADHSFIHSLNYWPYKHYLIIIIIIY